MRILLIEDDELLVPILVQALEDHNYVVDIATDGETGWDYAQSVTYDLIVLDVSLPKLDGISVCSQLRQYHYKGLILLLTAKGDPLDKVMGLDAGADDYVVKPCTVQELLARIRALLRRRNASGAPILQRGDLCLDPSSCRVTYKGQLLSLSAKEYGFLELFLRNPHRTFSSSSIIEQIWSFEDPPGDDTVRAHIKRVRRKLKDAGAGEVIKTIYGIGYCLNPVSENQPTTSPQIESAVAEAWEKLKDHALERITILEQAITVAQNEPLPEKLRTQAEQAAHKLAGSLGMFGFTEGSQLGLKIESLLQNPNETGWVAKLESMVARLYRELEKPLKYQKQTEYKKQITTDRKEKSLLLLVIAHDREFIERLEVESAKARVQVEVALDIIQARAKTSQTLPDVVLLDLSFSNSDPEGLVFLEELKTKFSELPMLVLSEEDDFNVCLEVARHGNFICLVKSMQPSKILEVIRDVLPKDNSRKIKVLAVDDDPLILETLKRFLNPKGFQVISLQDSREFWQTLSQILPDIVLLDLEMPHINGIELCQVIRNDVHWNSLPILFLTSHRDPQVVNRLYQAGADDYLSKPFTEPELLTRIYNRFKRLGIQPNLKV